MFSLFDLFVCLCTETYVCCVDGLLASSGCVASLSGLLWFAVWIHLIFCLMDCLFAFVVVFASSRSFSKL